jgi:hypothetical protein
LPDRVRVSDDEIGVEPAVLPREVCAGHWGLQGMPKRARHINGQLEVWSESGVGTEARVVDLAHPKTAVPNQMTRQLPFSQWTHREQRRLPKPADWISSTM